MLHRAMRRMTKVLFLGSLHLGILEGSKSGGKYLFNTFRSDMVEARETEGEDDQIQGAEVQTTELRINLDLDVFCLLFSNVGNLGLVLTPENG